MPKNVTINGQNYTNITQVKLLKTGTTDTFETFYEDAGVDLSAIEIFVADLTNSNDYVITKGAVDGYKRIIIS